MAKVISYTLANKQHMRERKGNRMKTKLIASLYRPCYYVTLCTKTFRMFNVTTKVFRSDYLGHDTNSFKDN